MLDGELTVPSASPGVVLFAHGSGSSRHSPRNRYVARMIQSSGLGTLLFDLLTREEEEKDADSGRFRFDIQLLAQRLVLATQWVSQRPETQNLGIGYFGASTGGAAALVAAAAVGSSVQAVVSRGGRPDLARDALAHVSAPTLLIVGARDDLIVSLNQEALAQLNCPKELVVVPRATHLFEEHGALEQVASLASRWFHDHLRRR